MLITDHDQIVKALESRAEELQHENDTLRAAIAEHCDAFGHESYDACGLQDVRDKIDRLLEGRDVDCGIEYPGITGEIEALVWLAQHAGTDDKKTKMYFARLSYPKTRHRDASVSVPPLITVDGAGPRIES